MNTRNPRYDILFEPVEIGPVTAPNRFYSVPHATGHSPMMPNGSIGLRETKAEGGWGVVSMQLAEIDPSSNISNLPMETFWDDNDVKSHALMIERVKQHGALTAIEIGHTGLRSRNMTTGVPVWGPSSTPCLKPDVPVSAKAMDKADIKQFRQSHRDAVLRAKQAGYDIVYVYVAHDASLLWHFLAPHYNFRTDEYGGSFENRLRLLREVMENTVEAAAGDIAVAIRFAVHDFKPGSVLTFDKEAREVVERLAELPDLWDVNVSGWSRDSGTSRYDAESHQNRYTSFVKQVTTKPVVGVGRFTSPDTMLKQIQSGLLDFVGATRASIADPFLPHKINTGQEDNIRECIGCNICVASDAYSIPLRCTQNPTISEEWRRGWHPERVPAATKKRHALIVGSGPAGLECALTLAKAGCDVTIAEKAREFGGRVIKESKLRGLGAWSRVIDYRLTQLKKMPNVALYADNELCASDALNFDADTIVVATGATWRRDGAGRSRFTPLDGFDDAALSPDDVMSGVSVNGSVIVYDDDHYYMGNIIAAQLAAHGHQVRIVCPLPIIGSWMDFTLEQPRMIDELISAGVAILVNTTANGWADGTLDAQHSDPFAALPSLHADTLISVTSCLPNDQLYLELSEKVDSGRTLSRIGDCVAPGIIQAAVFSGHHEARKLLGDTFVDGHYRRELPVLFSN